MRQLLCLLVFIFCIFNLNAQNCISLNEIGVDVVNCDGCSGTCASGCGEFTEFYNSCGYDIDISCYLLCDASWCLTIEQGTVIPANGFIVFGSTSTDWLTAQSNLYDMSAYTNANGVSGTFSDFMVFSNSSSDQIGLFDDSGNFISGAYWNGGNSGLTISGIDDFFGCNSNSAITFPNTSNSNFYNIGSAGAIAIGFECNNNTNPTSDFNATTSTPGYSNIISPFSIVEILVTGCPYTNSNLNFELITDPPNIIDPNTIEWTISGASTVNGFGTTFNNISFANDGVFTIEVNEVGNLNCLFGSFSQQQEIFDGVELTINADNTNVCGTTNVNIGVTNNLSNSSGFYILETSTNTYGLPFSSNTSGNFNNISTAGNEYIVASYYDVNNCVFTDSIFISNAGVDVQIIADQIFACPGDTIELSINGQPGFTTDFSAISPGEVLNFVGAYGINVIPNNLPTTYTISGTDNFGCAFSESITIQESTGLPIINLEFPPIICESIPFQITNLTQNAVGFEWNFNGAVNTDSYDVNPIVEYSNDANFIIELFAFGCSGDTVYHTQTITVNQFPFLQADDRDVCEDEFPLTLDLSIGVSGSLTFDWQPANIFVDNTIENPVISTPLTESTAINVTVCNANGCCKDESFFVNVGQFPEYYFDIAGDCNSSFYDITNNSVNGDLYTFNWFGSNIIGSSLILTGDAITIDLGTNTDYSIFVVDLTFGCEADTVITIENSSTLNPAIVGDVQLCSGTSLALTATGGETYQWLPVSEFDNATATNVAYTPTITSGTATIKLVAFDLSGCSDTIDYNINVIDAAEINLSAVFQTVCEGDSATIDINTNTSNINITNSNFWNYNGGTSYSFFPIASTTFTVDGSNNICAAQSSLVVNVITAGNIDVTSSTLEFCENSIVELTAVGLTDVIWTDHFSILNTDLTDNPIMVQVPNNTTTYTVNSNSGTCLNEGSFTINPIQSSITYDISLDNLEICEGSSDFVPSIGSIIGGGNVSFLVNNYNGIDIPTDLNGGITFNPTVTTNYIIEVFPPSGQCPAIDSILVTVNNPMPIDYTISDTTLCPNEIAELEIDLSFSSVSFTPFDGSITNISLNEYTLSPMVNTTYTISAFDINNCETETEIEVLVNTQNDITLNNPNPTICIGDTVDIVVSNVQNIFFDPSPFMNQITGTFAQYFPNSSQNFTITAEDELGCVDELEFLVNVQLNANLTFDQPNYTVCANNTITIEVSAGGTDYIWDPIDPNLTLNANGSIATYNAPNTAQTLSFNIVSQLSGSCLAIDSVEIVVNPNPQIAISENFLEMCGNAEANIVVSGVDNFSFSGGTGLDFGILPNELIATASNTNTTYTITGSNNFNCFDSTQLTINGLPNNGFNFTTVSNQICQGFNINLSVTGGGTDYVWLPNISNSVNGTTADDTPMVNTTYYVTSEISDYCTYEDSIEIEVHEVPTLNITNPNVVLCPNSSTTEFLSIIGDFVPNGTLQVNSNDLTVISNTEILVEPSFLIGSQTYELFYDTNFGCTSPIANLTVTIEDELPVAVVATDNTICEGESLQLTFTGATNYTFTPTINTTTISNNIIEVFPTTNTTYTINGNIGSCVGDTTFDVTVLQNPTIAIDVPSPTTICFEDAEIINLTGADSYTFTPNTNVLALSATSFELTPTTSTTYTITGEALNGCTSTATFVLNIDPFTNIGLSLSNNNICIGENATITAANGDTFNWQFDATLDNTTNAIVNANPITTTTYTVDATSNSGCTLTESITLNVAPQMVTNTSGNQFVCENGNITLFASGGLNYSWLPTTYLSNANIENPVCTPLANIIYTVTISDMFGCEETETVEVNVVNSPVLDVEPLYDVCVNDTIFFNFSAQNFNTISWSGGNGIFDNPNMLNTFYVLDAQETEGSVFLTVDLTSDCGNLQETVELSIIEDLTSINAGEDQEICSNQVFIFPEIISEFDLNWYGGDGEYTTYENSLQYTPTQAEVNNNVVLYLEESNICSSVIDSFNLFVNEIEQTQILDIIGELSLNDVPGQSEFVTVQLDSTGIYEWNFPQAVGCNYAGSPSISECFLVDLFPTTTTTFEVVDITDQCKLAAALTIEVDEFESGYLYIPTAFSPNGDGVNDVFKLRHNKINLETFILQIFNRYGQLVFETDNPANKWNGLYNNYDQGVNVFVWMVSYSFTYDDEILTEQGNVTLIR